MNRKDKSLNTQRFNRNNKNVAATKAATRIPVLSFGTDTAPQPFCHSFIALSIIRCWKSAQKSAVQMCQVANIVMETTQLVL